MTRTMLKFTFAGAVLLSAIAYLAYAGMQEGWVSYHLTVDAFVSEPRFQAQKVRLAGMVAEEGLVMERGRLGAEFNLAGEGQRLPVKYAGVVPDLFKAGCEVVVEGRLDGSGVFQADLVMTKCASKYESGEHGRPKE